MSEELVCPCCDGKGIMENRRTQLVAALKAVYIQISPEDQREVDLYAEYLRTRRKGK